MKSKSNHDKETLEELKRIILEEKKDLNSDEVANLTKDLDKSFIQEMKNLNGSSNKKRDDKK